ncbi:Serine/threonine-protein phosphatase 2C [Spironucleus salmonicida]|uniref:Serine/threonine-protein phosphatase 2C n=1 Tax=Spironucleus salmonicida TaxID=348837 RepID=V6LZ69_9EUKA|nr:Serine/threonine-protein phosphatase 2C [Spironucleus salmonicida]|eukprot:EST49036.1 Serine/threonine-protein phosphatase 2C [Spironucleus salmonicida]
MLKITSVYGIGQAEDQNPRWRKTMEDATVMVDRFGNAPTTGYFAVYDGHGGPEAARTAAESVHKILAEEAAKQQPQEVLDFDTLDFALAANNAIQRADQLQKQRGHVYVGCTACCLVVSKLKYLIMNVGDSRSVLSRRGQAIRLSKDHKATDAEEQERIKKAGGAVVGGRVNGFISVSRALGDHCIKQLVISDPQVADVARDPTDQFVIVGCDGVWDVLSDQQAVEICLKVLKDTQSPQRAAAELKNAALRANTQDNVSVLVLVLKDPQQFE